MGALWIGVLNTGFWLVYEWLCARHKEDSRLRRGKRVLTPLLGCVAMLTWVLAVVMVGHTDGMWAVGALALAALCLCANWSILLVTLSRSPQYFIQTMRRIRPSKWPEDRDAQDRRSMSRLFIGSAIYMDLFWIALAAAVVWSCLAIQIAANR
jgi:hypothetical protein